jgi:hypothetical protein
MIDLKKVVIELKRFKDNKVPVSVSDTWCHLLSTLPETLSDSVTVASAFDIDNRKVVWNHLRQCSNCMRKVKSLYIKGLVIDLQITNKRILRITLKKKRPVELSQIDLDEAVFKEYDVDKLVKEQSYSDIVLTQWQRSIIDREVSNQLGNQLNSGLLGQAQRSLSSQQQSPYSNINEIENTSNFIRELIRRQRSQNENRT